MVRHIAYEVARLTDAKLALERAGARLEALLEYTAMMTDVELPEEEADEE